jgi:hypothetical protein
MNELIEKINKKDSGDRGMRSFKDDFNELSKEEDWTHNIIPWED